VCRWFHGVPALVVDNLLYNLFCRAFDLWRRLPDAVRLSLPPLVREMLILIARWRSSG